MSFISNKTDEVNSKIAVLKTVAETSSNKLNKAKSGAKSLMDSILEIYDKVGGYNDMIKTIEDVLSKNLGHIEDVVKSSVKIALKQIISCGIEPSITDELISTGVTFDVKKIDPMLVLTLDPTSEEGTYAYFDIPAEINSSDFNVFLYYVIKNTINNPSYDGATWNRITTESGSKIKTPLFKVSYKEYDENLGISNALNIKIDSSFKGQKLSFFISEYLDSVKLFNNVHIISSIFDEILGGKIINIKKTTEQIITGKKVSSLIENIINNIEDSSDVLDDSYYTFSNDTYDLLLKEAEDKKTGRLTYGDNNGSVDKNILLDSLMDLNKDGLLVSEQTEIFKNVVEQITENLNDKGVVKDKDKFSFKFDFIKKIIKKLTTTLTMYVLSPKIIYLFYMVSKIYGLDTDGDIITFIKKHINILKIIIVEIRNIIIKVLVKKIMEKLKPLIEAYIKIIVKEKFLIYTTQLAGIMDVINKAAGAVTTAISALDSNIGQVKDKTGSVTDNADKII